MMSFEEEQKRLEQAAGPHPSRTTEMVGVDDIGLPSGIQPEDAQASTDAQENPASAAGQKIEPPTSPIPVPASSPGLNPGDEAAPGTEGSGDDVCPACTGSGKNANGDACPNCGGTGIVTEGVGGG